MTITIRAGEVAEVVHFAMYSDDNEGEITVAEQGGEVIAFMQHVGAYIYILESNKAGTGAGVALVDWLKEDNDEVYALDVAEVAEGFWVKQGFEFNGRAGIAKNFVWYAE